MSRNADRITLEQVTETTPIPEQPLTYSPPTSLVALPSKGKFYPQGHPLHNAETVEIKQMTTREEEILINQNLAQKGLTIDRLIKSVLVDKSINVGSLLIGDKNAILIAMRVEGYGSDYEVTLPCPSCSHSNEVEIDLSKLQNKSDTDGVEVTEDGYFIATLPKTKARVELRLLTGADEKEIQATNKKNKKYGTDRPLATQYSKMIVSVNDNREPTYISSFAANLPASDSRLLRKIYKTINPDVDLSFNFQCEQCGHEQGMEVPIGANFFWID